MRPLNKEQARAPKRDTVQLSLPEYGAPLLLAKPSGGLAVRFSENKVNLGSAEALTAMVADMAVDEDGARLFSPDQVPDFLDGISAESLTALMTKCYEMYAGRGGGQGNSQPSTSAA